MAALLQACLTFAYPFIVLGALSAFEPRGVALVVMALFGVRALVARRRVALPQPAVVRSLALAGLPAVVVVGASAVWNHPLGLLLTPVLINAALFVGFARSLAGEPVVETLARLSVGRLAPAEVRHCRSVTRIWCGFFVVNGAIALVLALQADERIWAFYTGFVAYLSMGVLFAAEYVVRQARFRRYEGGFAAALFARWLPPHDRPERVAVADPDGSTRRLALEVRTGLTIWPGHFPGDPMLPGVLQLDWALREIECWQGTRPVLREIEGLKFRRPVRPGEALELVLARESSGRDGKQDEGPIFGFEFRRGDEQVSRGRIHCGPFGDASAGARSNPASDAPTAPATAAAGASGASMDATRWPLPAQILCHAAPMIWLESIEDHGGNGTRCLVRAGDARCLHDAAGRVGAHAALEWMAQAVAAHAGLVRRARGLSPALGLLLGARQVRFGRTDFAEQEQLRVCADPAWVGEQGAASFDCRVETVDSGELVANARLSCFLPEGTLVGKIAG